MTDTTASANNKGVKFMGDEDDNQPTVQEADQPEVNRRAMAAGRYYKDKNGKLWINGKPVENPPLPKPKPKMVKQPNLDIAKQYLGD